MWQDKEKVEIGIKVDRSFRTSKQLRTSLVLKELSIPMRGLASATLEHGWPPSGIGAGLFRQWRC